MPIDMNVIYTITLSDGTKIHNLSLNGNNFVSQEEVTEEMFAGKLSEVVITANDKDRTEYVMHNVRLLQIQTYPQFPDMPGWFFVLQEIPEEELRMMQMQANIQYIAMMSDCEL